MRLCLFVHLGVGKKYRAEIVKELYRVLILKDFSSGKTKRARIGEAIVNSCTCGSVDGHRNVCDALVWSNILCMPAVLIYFSKGWFLAAAMVFLSGCASILYHAHKEDKVCLVKHYELIALKLSFLTFRLC